MVFILDPKPMHAGGPLVIHKCLHCAATCSCILLKASLPVYIYTVTQKIRSADFKRHPPFLHCLD